jgi:hypothetical protein
MAEQNERIARLIEVAREVWPDAEVRERPFGGTVLPVHEVYAPDGRVHLLLSEALPRALDAVEVALIALRRRSAEVRGEL